MNKVLIIIVIFAIFYSSTAVDGGKNQFDPEELESFKTIGRQIARYMCRHLHEVLETLNITKSDLL